MLFGQCEFHFHHDYFLFLQRFLVCFKKNGSDFGGIVAVDSL